MFVTVFKLATSRTVFRFSFLSIICLVVGAFFAIEPSLMQGPVDAKKGEKPLIREYRGVFIGMAMAEARQKLGESKDKSDQQDFYVFSEKENVSVYYDESKKVTAVSVIYMGAESGAPEPKAVLGPDIEIKSDGSCYKAIRYQEAGYWVSYSRTAGAEPMVSVTMKKID